MDSGVEELLQLIKSMGPVPTGPVTLSAEYLRLVAYVENLPFNREGADKSWVWRLVEADREHFSRVRPA